MKVDLHIDTARALQKLKTMGAASVEAEPIVMRELLRVFIEGINEIAPRDTNRYIRGWLLAANDVGLKVPVVPLEPNSRRTEYLAKLAEQIDSLDKQIEGIEKRLELWYERKGRRLGAWGRKRKSELRKLRRRRVRAGEELDKALGTEYFSYFDAGSAFEAKNKRKLSTVREKIYGGKGEMFTAGGQLFVRLTNMEPHANIVEKRRRPRDRAMERVRGSGLRRAGRAYIKRIQQTSGAYAKSIATDDSTDVNGEGTG